MWLMAACSCAEFPVLVHLAPLVGHDLEQVRVQHLVAAVHPSPHPGRAKLGRRHRGLSGDGIEVFIRHELRTVAVSAVDDREAMELERRPREDGLLALGVRGP